MEPIKLYTDGACRGNGTETALGGWGAVLLYNGHAKELKGTVLQTTNNRMEIIAAINGLSAINNRALPVQVYTDSAYLCNCIVNGWYVKWRHNGWKNAKGEEVANKDLWNELLSLLDTFKLKPEFIKVKGHSGNVHNDRCDKLANEAMDECILNGRD